MSSSTITFVAADNQLRGKRAESVGKIIQRLVEAEGEPLTFDELTRGLPHVHQYTPALQALELVGAVERWHYREPGKVKKQTAYSLADSVEVVEP